MKYQIKKIYLFFLSFPFPEIQSISIQRSSSRKCHALNSSIPKHTKAKNSSNMPLCLSYQSKHFVYNYNSCSKALHYPLLLAVFCEWVSLGIVMLTFLLLWPRGVAPKHLYWRFSLKTR